MSQYWVVGSKFGGREDKLPTFKRRGYWYCWELGSSLDDTSSKGNSVKNQQDRFKKIAINDRLAVKNMNIATQKMEILALGIVKDTDFEEWRIYVDWLPETHQKIVELKGCTASIHGPYKHNDAELQDWIHEIFCI